MRQKIVYTSLLLTLLVSAGVLCGCSSRFVTKQQGSFPACPADSVMIDGKQEDKTEMRPQNMFRVAIGPSWISSKVYVTYNAYYKYRGALDVCADYEHLWQNGAGVGVNFASNHVSFDQYGSFTQTYLGPSFVYAYRWTKHIGLECALGLGCSFYAEQGGYNDVGLGTMCKLGVEYLCTEHFGIGLQYSAWSSYYSKPDDFQLANDEQYRLDRFGFQVGLHYYF